MNRCIQVNLLAVVSCAAVAAWQAGPGAIGVTDSEMPAIAKAYLLSGDNPQLPAYYALGGEMRNLWKSKGPADRAQEIRQLAAYAKQFVSTAAFEKTYNEWIKQQYNAVDHGLKPQQFSAASAPQAMSQMGAIMAASMKNIPTQTLKGMFDSDLENWKDDEDQAKIYAKAKQIAPLFSSNPEEWKRQYIQLKSESMGGPATEAAGDQIMGDLKQRQEQQAFDQYNLKAMLKKRLQDFITLARSVDFSAQTQARGKLQVFVNPDYERKPMVWKELYRLGKDPTQAATAAAEQWLQQL